MVDTFDPGQAEQNWQGVTLTLSAAEQISNLIAGKANILGLRLGVKKSGCAGFAYDLSLAEEDAKTDTDFIYESEGARVYVPQDAIAYIDGTQIDYVSEGINKVFKFNNPKAANSCGCGESFGTVKDS